MLRTGSSTKRRGNYKLRVSKAEPAYGEADSEDEEMEDVYQDSDEENDEEIAAPVVRMNEKRTQAAAPQTGYQKKNGRVNEKCLKRKLRSNGVDSTLQSKGGLTEFEPKNKRLRLLKESENERSREVSQAPSNASTNKSRNSLTAKPIKAVNIKVDKRALFTKGSAEDYRMKMFATIRTYKFLTLDRTPGTRPFMQRNLWWMDSYNGKPRPLYYLGENEPPKVYPGVVKRHTQPIPNPRMQRQKLHDVISAIRNRKKISNKIAAKNETDGFSFSVGTLSQFTKSGQQALYNDSAFRRFMLNQSKILPAQTNFNRSSITTESDLSSSASSKENYSVVLRSITDKFVPGDGEARFSMWLVHQHGTDYQEPVQLTNTVHYCHVNKTVDIFVNLPRIAIRPSLKVHLLIYVQITTDNVEKNGRAFRRTNDRIKDETNTFVNPKKKWDHSYYATLQVFGGQNMRTLSDRSIAFQETKTSLALVNASLMTIPYTHRDFVAELRSMARKHDINAFVKVAVEQFSAKLPHNNEDLTNGTVPNRKPRGHENQSKEAMQPAATNLDISDPKSVSRMLASPGLEHLFGLFPSFEGPYINDKEMIKNIFHDPNIFDDRKKRYTIQSWFPIDLPSSVHYRILATTVGPSAPTQDPKAMEDNGEMTTVDEIIDLEESKLQYMYHTVAEEPGRCIICNRKFGNLFELMMHYSSNYPRLAFSFDMNRCHTDKVATEVHIDVTLNPHLLAEKKCIYTHQHWKLFNEAPVFMLYPRQARVLKMFFRMDMTLFCHIMKNYELLDQNDIRANKNTDRQSDGFDKFGFDVRGVHPRTCPHPSYKVLKQYINHQVMDFIDIDEETKKYMCLWNELTLVLGRCNIEVCGPYQLYRLFLDVFSSHMKEHNQMDRFVSQLTVAVERGSLSACDIYDIIKRLDTPEYNPLDDLQSSLVQTLLVYGNKMYRKYCIAAANTKGCGAPRQGQVNFHFWHRIDPVTMKDDERKKFVRYLYNHTNALSRTDPRRLYTTNIYKMVFRGEIPAIFETICNTIDC